MPPSSQRAKGRLILAQSTSAYPISDPVVNFPTLAKSGLTSAYSSGASAKEIYEKNRNRLLLCQYHANYQTCERYLKTIFLDSIPEILPEEQKYEPLGFGDKTIFVLITQLWVTYGNFICIHPT